MISAPPCSVSSDFGQLVGIRHLISGIDWAIAGAAMVAAPATPIPVTLIKSRRFIEFFLLWVSASLRVEACPQHGTSGSGTPWRTDYRNAKSPASRGGRACDLRLKEYQPRVR